jgi:hypothetical protein
MQDHEPSTPGNIWSRDAAGGQLPGKPASLYPWDFFSPDRDEVLVLRKPYGDRARTIWLSTMALVASFGLGWAGGLNWPEFASMLGFSPIAQKETPSPRTSETRSGGKIEGARKTTSTSGLQTPPGASTASATGASISAKPPATSPGGAHLSTDSSSTVSSASLANTSPPAVAVAARGPLVPAPETRPTTISGWTVIDVRDGTAVLEGPDGIRMATRGDTIPGIGRVESIVRWGNRWIVATAAGLIATP